MPLANQPPLYRTARARSGSLCCLYGVRNRTPVAACRSCRAGLSYLRLVGPTPRVPPTRSPGPGPGRTSESPRPGWPVWAAHCDQRPSITTSIRRAFRGSRSKRCGPDSRSPRTTSVNRSSGKRRRKSWALEETVNLLPGVVRDERSGVRVEVRVRLPRPHLPTGDADLEFGKRRRELFVDEDHLGAGEFAFLEFLQQAVEPLEIGPILPLARPCRHGRGKPGRVGYSSNGMMDARWRNPRKLRAVFSYRVATRRYCLIRPQNRSTRFRSLYRSASIPRRTFRFLWVGITARAPVASTARTTAAASYPLSAITTAAAVPATSAALWVTSAACPGVRMNLVGSPSPLTRTWTLVPNPPRLRPSACSPRPPDPSAFFSPRPRTGGPG